MMHFLVLVYRNDFTKKSLNSFISVLNFLSSEFGLKASYSEKNMLFLSNRKIKIWYLKIKVVILQAKF